METSFNNIRAEISRRGWTIEQFCREIGIAKRTFYDWESKKDFPVSYAILIAEMFCVSVDYIIGIKTA